MKSFETFLTFLTESRVDFLKQKYNNLSTTHDPFGKHKLSTDIVDHFVENADPHKNKKYSDWILNQYKSGKIRQEDAPDINDTLKNFTHYQKKLEKKDLNSYSSIDELRTTLRNHIGVDPSYKEIEPHPDAPLIHSENGVEVHQLNSKHASRHYFKGGSVCTARNDEHCQHDNYSKVGQLYHIKGRTVEVDSQGNHKMADYNLFLGNGAESESSDKYNEHKGNTIREIAERNPELRNVKEFQGKHPALTADENFDKHFHSLILSNLTETIADKRLKSHHIDKLVNAVNNDTVRRAIAKHPNLQQHHIDKLVDDDSSLVKAAIAKHPKLQQHHIDKLVGDEYGIVKETIAAHPNLQQHHIDKLVNDKDPYVKAAIAKHPKLQQHHIDELVGVDHHAVKIAIAKRSDLQQHHIDTLVNDDDPDVKEAIAAHPKLQQHHIDKLVNDGDPYVKEAIKQHPLYKKLYGNK